MREKMYNNINKKTLVSWALCQRHVKMPFQSIFETSVNVGNGITSDTVIDNNKRKNNDS